MALILLKLSVEILLLPLVWKLHLFAVKGMYIKIQKIMSGKTQSYHVSMGRTNLSHEFLSSAVNCENKTLLSSKILIPKS